MGQDIGGVVTGDGGPTRAQLVEMLRKSRNVDIVDLIGYIDALTAEVARLRASEAQRDDVLAKLRALVETHDAREERGWDTQSVAAFGAALDEARSAWGWHRVEGGE